MIELLVTCFPAAFQFWRLKRRGEHITVWNMHQAVFAWLVLATALFMTIFYYHPKSFSGMVPFRVAPVVPQTGGPVTSIKVVNGQHVSKGDLLFTIENSRQIADVAMAKAKAGEVVAAFSVAKAQLQAVKGKVDSARASLKQATEEFNRKNAAKRNTFRRSEIERLKNQKASRQGRLNAALSEYKAMKANVSKVLPAQQRSAQAALQKAENELTKTSVRAFTNGTVLQVALSEGATATRLVLRPSMIIVPDRPDGAPLKFVAGFSQAFNNVLKEGMPVEISCDSNTNLFMENVVLPARITYKQDAIAAGQVTASGSLIELNNHIKRGSILVHMELVHKDHEKRVLNGSGCIVQAYTNDIPGTVGHIIGALGAVKAILFRIKVWGTLVVGIGLSGGGK